MSIDLRNLIMETDRPTYRSVKQRGKILEYKNFDFRKHQTDGNRVYYRCAERNKYGCKATLAIGKETGIVLLIHCRRVRLLQGLFVAESFCLGYVCRRECLSRVFRSVTNSTFQNRRHGY